MEYLDTIISVMKNTTKINPYKTELALNLFSNSFINQRFQLVLDYNFNGKNTRINSKIVFTLLLSLFMTLLFIVQPHYEPEVDKIEGSIISDNNTFILKEDDNYGLYINSEFIKTIKIDELQKYLELGIQLMEE